MDFFHRINKFLALGRGGDEGPRPVSRTAHGSAAEAAAVAWLQRQGLQLLVRNYKTPDAIMRAADGTLVFVEVRVRANSRHGGAAASIGSVKQRRIIHAAQQFLQRFPEMPPCRFDVMACDQPGPPWQWTWIVAAFDAA